MKIFVYILLAVLVFLAVSSGLTKVMLMQQDVDFFAPYGFTNPILMAFGAIQIAGGILLGVPKTRIIGACIVAITFLISAVVLLLSDNLPVAGVTLLFVFLLGFVISTSRKTRIPSS